MFENYTIPAGFEPVADTSSLASSAIRSSIFFFEGDEITCSDKVVSKVRTDRDGKTVTDKDGKPILVYYLVCSVNGGTPKPIPFGSFRRFPREADAFLGESDLMRQLYGGSDEDRFNLIKGKTLKVKRLVEGDAIDWTQSDAATRSYVYKKAKFPVLVLK